MSPSMVKVPKEKKTFIGEAIANRSASNPRDPKRPKMEELCQEMPTVSLRDSSSFTPLSRNSLSVHLGYQDKDSAGVRLGSISSATTPFVGAQNKHSTNVCGTRDLKAAFSPAVKRPIKRETNNDNGNAEEDKKNNKNITSASDALSKAENAKEENTGTSKASSGKPLASASSKKKSPSQKVQKEASSAKLKNQFNTPSPKQDLNNYYTSKGLLNQNQLKDVKPYYTIWNNIQENTMSHDMKFTCIFTCPVTGEHFGCGHYLNDRSCSNLGVVEDDNGVFWYQNTKMAMNAAAAKALDCFSFRECIGSNDVPAYRCRDAPHLKNAISLSPVLPSGVVLPAVLLLSDNEKTRVAKEDNLQIDDEPGNICNHESRKKEVIICDEIKKTGNKLEATDVPIKRISSNAPLKHKSAAAPRQELNEAYIMMGCQSQINDLKQCYTTWYDEHHNPKPHEKKFTCIFTCPITGEHFACGYWDNGGSIISEGGVFWYQNSKLAMNAAAAKALDCFSFRECQESNDVPFLRCADAPYSKENPPPLPKLPEGVTLPKVLMPNACKDPPYSIHDIALDNGSKRKELSNLTAKQALHQWYETYWRRISKSHFVLSHSSTKRRLPEKDCFSSWTNRKSNAEERRFTSVFTCPWTGERYLSGKLIGKDREYYVGDAILDEKPEGSVKRLVWYRTKKEAENASAGRALDCQNFRDRNEKSDLAMSAVRYCIEPPYGIEDSTHIELDVSQRLSGVTDFIWEVKGPPIEYKVVWKKVPLGDRIPIRYRHCY